MEFKLEFEIDRKRWLRGQGSMDSFLLRSSDNKMCCMGSFCRAIGHTPSTIDGVRAMGHLKDKLLQDKFPWAYDRSMENMLGEACTTHIGHIYQANDDPSITDQVREEKLTKLFAEQGVKVTFIN